MVEYAGRLTAELRSLAESRPDMWRLSACGVTPAELPAAGDALKKYVQRLRRKLGDDARNPKWIKTVHGLGYRLTTPVSAAS